MPEGDGVGNYRFTDEVVGEGAFSTVRKCFDLHEKPVAIKCIRLSEIRSNTQLLKRELRILQKVQHPAIVTYLSCFHDPEHIYIVTELCEGGNLVDRVRRQARLPEAFMRKTTKSLFEGLVYLHALHICHRDIKAENVLFTSDDRAKIIDFGLARIMETDRLVSVVGTPYYLAPEVPDGKYDTKCDVWSLAVVVFFGLAGRLPFEGRDWEELRKNVLSLNFGSWGSMSEAAKLFLLKLFQIDPKQRLSAEEALREEWLQC